MATKLKSEQVKLLDNLIMQNPKAFSWEELPREKIDEIVAIDDHEMVWIRMNIYIKERWFWRAYE